MGSFGCNKGAVYLLIEREFIDSKQNIYKIGRTRQEPREKRFETYPKNSRLILMYDVDDCVETENMIKNRFLGICSIKHRIDVGCEYFEGELDELVAEFLIIFRKSIVPFKKSLKKKRQKDNIEKSKIPINLHIKNIDDDQIININGSHINPPNISYTNNQLINKKNLSIINSINVHGTNDHIINKNSSLTNNSTNVNDTNNLSISVIDTNTQIIDSSPINDLTNVNKTDGQFINESNPPNIQCGTSRITYQNNTSTINQSDSKYTTQVTSQNSLSIVNSTNVNYANNQTTNQKNPQIMNSPNIEDLVLYKNEDSYKTLIKYISKQNHMDNWYNSNVIYYPRQLLTLKASWDNFYKYYNQLNIDDCIPLKREFKKYMENKIGTKVIKSSTIKNVESGVAKNHRNFWYNYTLK